MLTKNKTKIDYWWWNDEKNIHILELIRWKHDDDKQKQTKQKLFWCPPPTKKQTNTIIIKSELLFHQNPFYLQCFRGIAKY